MCEDTFLPVEYRGKEIPSTCLVDHKNEKQLCLQENFTLYLVPTHGTLDPHLF